jgi:hypothetical protein
MACIAFAGTSNVGEMSLRPGLKLLTYFGTAKYLYKKTFSVRKGARILYKSTKYVISHFVKGLLAMLPVHLPEYA